MLVAVIFDISFKLLQNTKNKQKVLLKPTRSQALSFVPPEKKSFNIIIWYISLNSFKNKNPQNPKLPVGILAPTTLCGQPYIQYSICTGKHSNITQQEHQMWKIPCPYLLKGEGKNPTKPIQKAPQTQIFATPHKQILRLILAPDYH